MGDDKNEQQRRKEEKEEEERRRANRALYDQERRDADQRALANQS